MNDGPTSPDPQPVDERARQARPPAVGLGYAGQGFEEESAVSSPPENEHTRTEPPSEGTDIRASHKQLKGEWVFVDANGPRGAWMEVDDQHVWGREDMQ